MKYSGKKRGFALVVTMMVMALIVVLFTAAALVSAKESRRAGSEAGSVGAKIMAESGLHLGLARVRAAVEDREGKDPEGDPALWSSQPGLIRTYRDDGSPLRFHKLYSSAQSTVEGSEEAFLDSVKLDQDVTSEEYFVDINAPRRDGQGSLKFPIVDPRAMEADAGESIEGFSYNVKDGPPGTVGPGEFPDQQRLPMPVRWIYILEDGVLTTEPNKRAQGRLAYWIDDESSKINLNTASEGVFWDSPRASTDEERTLAENQPGGGEFQRFPGHPATVSLSSVLFPGKRLGPAGTISRTTAAGTKVEPLDLPAAEAIWEMSPGVRADPESSLGGTRRPSAAGRPEENAKAPDPVVPPLYPTVAEALWERGTKERKMNRIFKEYPEAHKRFERGKFFLTTASSAPEITPYGTPKVTMWPVHGNLNPTTLDVSGFAGYRKVTNYDHKVAIASSIGDSRYYLTRSEAGNGARDFKYKQNGREQNNELYRYLNNLTSTPVPGIGMGSFTDKYGEDGSEQIVLGAFDYLRMTNLNDGALSGEEQFCVVCAGNEHVGFGQISPLLSESGLQAIGRVPVITEVTFVFTCRAMMQEDGSIKGKPKRGKEYELKDPGDRQVEMAMLVETAVPGHGWGEYRPYASIALGSVALDDLQNGGTPTPDTREDLLPELKVAGKTLVPASTIAITSHDDLPAEWRAWGAEIGPRAFNGGMIRFDPVMIPASVRNFAFSGTVGSPKVGGETRVMTMALFDEPSAAEATRDFGESDRLRTIVVAAPEIPHGRLTLPELPTDGVPFEFKKESRRGRATDRSQAITDGTRYLSKGDVIQSLVLRHGDPRIEAGQRYGGLGEDGIASFVAHPDWGFEQHAHALREPTAEAQALIDQKKSKLTHGFFPDLKVAAGVSPDLPIPAGGSGTVQALVGKRFEKISFAEAAISVSDPAKTGDFDNGYAFAPDGAYINRADDGDTRGYDDGGSPYFSVPPPVFTEFPQPDPGIFSPKRLVPSAVMFGSLPTGIPSQTPWQTLLFRPDFNGGHPGANKLPDHHLVDNFWMPVVEPWPISRPFETAGKINLNHQIFPFTHIQRATALHALLKAEMLFAIPDKDAATYKLNGPGLHQKTRPAHYRRFIDPTATLALWRESASERGGAFRVPSEVCTLPLVPEGVKDLERFWKEHRLTGDNSKERPYAHLLPRLTTQSNVFRIHLIAQSLRSKRSGSGFDVIGDIRGSALIRREIPFENRGENLPDYLAKDGEKPHLGTFARWQIDTFDEF